MDCRHYAGHINLCNPQIALTPNWTHIAILGAGESGVGAALLAAKYGLSVYLSDSKAVAEPYATELQRAGIAFDQEGHDEMRILQCDVVVKSPGIPNHIPLMQTITAQGVPIVSEIEFAARFTTAKLVAITGSNGKTTTTALTAHILEQAGIDVQVGGNIGKSFARLLAETPPAEVYVLEVSSFQCDHLIEFKPHIAIITNFSPDHLDRYNNRMEDYVAAKFSLLKNMDENDAFIYNTEDEWTQRMRATLQLNCRTYGFGMHPAEPSAAWINEHQNIIINNETIMNTEELALKGQHNARNSMASSMAARLLHVRKESIRDSLTNFDAIEHRLESLGTIRGVTFINDSKATNVNATWYALESVSKPVIWIAGGVDKGNDYTELMNLVEDKVKAIVCLGENNQKLLDEFTGHVKVITETRSMERAVKMAFSLADKNDTILLSPCCASFDLFDNYEDRGEQFKYWVRQL